MNLTNMKVGARLTAGFSCVLALLMLVSGISLWRMHQATAMTDRLVSERAKTERAIAGWESIIRVQAVRALAASRADDSATQKFFEDAMAAGTDESVRLQKEVEAGLSDATAKALFSAIAEKRAAYRDARTAALKAKQNGDADTAKRLFADAMGPKVEAYLQSVEKLSAYERDAIDDMAATLLKQSERGRDVVIALSAFAILVGLLCGYLIKHSLLSQLGGEPADAVAVARRIASGDLSVAIATRADDRTSLLFALREMRDSLSRLVAQVRSGTDSIAAASERIAAGSIDISSRTEQEASSLQQTASSMEEMAGAVKQNADNAAQANQLAGAASDIAQKGGAVVSQVVETMTSINESSARIADIISVIDGIAFQTNILALNAAVEAARAGEQGRGFAVVAAEVRNLAQRSAGAAREIKELISTSVEKVGLGTKLVDQAGATMEQVVTSIQRVNDIMSEITAASAEQTSGIGQINQAIAQMDRVTQQNATLVDEASAAAQSLQEQARGLAQAVGVFRLAGLAQSAPAPQAVVVPLPKPKAAIPAPGAARRMAKKVANLPDNLNRDWEEF